MKKWKMQQENTSLNDLLDFYTVECGILEDAKMEQARLLSKQEQEISDLQKSNSILGKAYLEGQGQIRALRQTVAELMKLVPQPEEQPDPGVEFRSKIKVPVTAKDEAVFADEFASITDGKPEERKIKEKIPKKPWTSEGKTWAPAPSLHAPGVKDKLDEATFGGAFEALAGKPEDPMKNGRERAAAWEAARAGKTWSPAP